MIYEKQRDACGPRQAKLKFRCTGRYSEREVSEGQALLSADEKITRSRNRAPHFRGRGFFVPFPKEPLNRSRKAKDCSNFPIGSEKFFYSKV